MTAPANEARPHKTPSSPPRPAHQTTRSMTEASFPKMSRPHHVHIHRHHHHHQAKETQSAHPNLPSNGGGINDGYRSEGVTPNGSQTQSRRTSVLGFSGELDALGEKDAYAKQTIPPEEVDAEKQKGVLGATELRNALTDLNKLSTNTASRLDNAYWRVLEKVSDLQRTIASLSALATMTRSLQPAFKSESQEIVREVEGTLSGFEGFQAQQMRIESLAEQVKRGRDKIKILGKRVEVVKGRVQEWERAEGEWQERTRRRLKVLWIVIAICGGLFPLGMVWRAGYVRTHGPGVLKGLNATELTGRVPDLEEDGGAWKSFRRDEVNISEKILEVAAETEERVDGERRLRVFDEL